MLNGLLANCHQPDVMFVRVQVSVDYSYAIRGVSPIRVDFYVELLPQTSTAMINGAGGPYTLVAWAGTADLRTLDAAHTVMTILDVLAGNVFMCCVGSSAGLHVSCPRHVGDMSLVMSATRRHCMSAGETKRHDI